MKTEIKCDKRYTIITPFLSYVPLYHFSLSLSLFPINIQKIPIESLCVIASVILKDKQLLLSTV